MYKLESSIKCKMSDNRLALDDARLNPTDGWPKRKLHTRSDKLIAYVFLTSMPHDA